MRSVRFMHFGAHFAKNLQEITANRPNGFLALEEKICSLHKYSNAK